MKYSRKIYGRAVIDSSKSDEIEGSWRIELEYYNLKEENCLNNKNYGIEIVKKRIENEIMNIENKIVSNIFREEQEANKLLQILMENKVTPISVDDVISDLKISMEQ